MVQSGMKAPRHSSYSRYSNNTLIGAGHSITPITPAGYYIAAVILEWSECHRGAPVTPTSIIGVKCQNPDSPTPRFWVSPRTYSPARIRPIWPPMPPPAGRGEGWRRFRGFHAVPTTAKIIIQVAYNLEKVASACKATMSGFMYPVLCETIGFYQLLTQGKRTLSRIACP